MTVLAVPEALPAALLVTYRLLLTRGPLPRQTAIERLSPSPQHTAFTDEAKKGVKAALSEGLGMGLFEEHDGQIQVKSTFSGSQPTVAAFRHLARRLILDVDNERNHDLARALSWFLTTDPYAAPTAQGWTDLQVQHPQANDVIGNDVKWGNFQRWAQFLGFAERVVVERPTSGRKTRAADVLMPNPTPALLDCWPHVKANLTPTVPVSEFLVAAAQVLPVLDEGAFGREFSPGGQTLTASMSLALLELRRAGHIDLDDRSDTDKWRLRHPDGTEVAYSHVLLKEGLRA